MVERVDFTGQLSVEVLNVKCGRIFEARCVFFSAGAGESRIEKGRKNVNRNSQKGVKCCERARKRKQRRG